MRVPYRQHWALWRIERRLRRSDPHLAAMLAIFARLTAGEVIASTEQAANSGSWMRRDLAWLDRRTVTVTMFLSAQGHRVLRRAAVARAWVRRHFSRTAMDAPRAGDRPTDSR
jgi:hypothetical protein